MKLLARALAVAALGASDRLRSVVDLSTGALLRSAPAHAARCPTILAGDSRV